MSVHPGRSTSDPARDDLDTEFVLLRADLLRLASAMTGSPEDAEDAVQDVWLRWQRHRGSVDEAQPWLRRVTRNVVIDRLRARQTSRKATLDIDLGRMSAAEPAALALETAAELRPGFHLVLSTLSPLERAVFVLHDGLDWSYADIARILDRSGPAVRQLRHRAGLHLASGALRFAVDPVTVAKVAAAYVEVSAGDDVFAFLEVLAPRLTSPRPVFRSSGRRVGHDVAGIVLFQDDRLLLCRRRADLGWYPGVWDVPGAHLRHGEPAIACAVRAAQHEIGVSVSMPHRLVEHRAADFRLTLFEGVGWVGRPRNRATAQHDEIGLFTREQASRLPLADDLLLSLFDRPAAA